MVALANLGLWERGNLHTQTDLETQAHAPIAVLGRLSDGRYFIITLVGEGDGLELNEVSGDFLVGEG